jgi:hypothetical protein
MVVLVGAVGLAIDGGRLFLERRLAQGAADHAATAAAHAQCNGNAAGAETAALAIAKHNGYDDDAPEVSVTVDADESPNYRVTVRSTVGALFMPVLGIGSFDASAEAVAGCIGGGSVSGPGAIFAGGDNCTNAIGKPGIKVNGGQTKVYGGLHSNADIGISGSTNRFTHADPPDDPITYVGSFHDGGSDNIFQDPPYPEDVGPSAPPWPAGWAPGDVAPLLDAYRTIAQSQPGHYSTNKIESFPNDGVYYTTHPDGIDVGSFSGSTRNVVLVAPNGTVKLALGSKTMAPYSHPDLPRQHILVIAGKTHSGTSKCGDFAIDVSGGTTSWRGIMWAPGGLIKMAGSSNSTVNGSLVGWAVELNGSDLTIQYDSSLFPTTPGEVLIIE